MAGTYISISEKKTVERMKNLLSGDSYPRDASSANQSGFNQFPLCEQIISFQESMNGPLEILALFHIASCEKQ